MKIHNIKQYKDRRKKLRNNSTKAEILLWKELKNSQTGYKFRRQHGIKQYIVDFYCPELKLIIEVDGEVHLEERQKKHDMKKDKELTEMGFNVVRFDNYDASKDTVKVLDKISEIARRTCR